MNLKDYARASALDFVLCLVLAASIGFVNCGAFFVSSALQFNIAALVLAAAVPLVLLFASAYSRKTVLPGAAVTLVVLVASCFAAHAIAGQGSMFADTEANPEIFILVMFLTTLVTFLMTRRRWMARVFVVVAILDICFVEFMYKQYCWQALIIALVALGTMVVYRNYRINLADASTPTISFASAFGIGAVYAAVLVGLACVVFFALIAPLNPPAKTIKLFTRYMTYETVQMTGIGDSSKDPGESERTSLLNDQQDQTNQDPEDEGTEDQETNSLLDAIGLAIGAALELTGRGIAALKELFNFLLENPQYIPLFLIAVLAVVASPFLIKKRLRAHWFSKTCALPGIACVERLYLFFLKRFGKLKVVKSDSQTLNEFAESSKGALHEFSENESHADFKTLTDIYCKGVYGGEEPSEEELDAFKAYYRHFYKAFVASCGRPKYVLRFFGV